MNQFPSPIAYYARLVICSAALLCSVQNMCASEAEGSPKSNAAEPASGSASASSSPAGATSEEATEKLGKFDVSRIGQRSIGHGVNLYSVQKERALGEEMAANIDHGAKFVTDPAINEYVNKLGQKIARNSDAQVPFTIKVIDSPTLRIFALPGGFLYVDKGLIMEVDNEAELAGMMAHEIAHVAARHATRFATRKYAWNVVTIPLAYLSGPAALATRQITPLTLSKFSREAELEADLLGIEYQYAANYDPHAFVEALEKLHSKETELHARITKGLPNASKVPLHNQVARAFANYPTMEERIQKVQTAISTLLPSRNEYVSDTSEFQEVRAKLAWADRPILRRHRAGGDTPRGPVLRHPAQDLRQTNFADASPAVTKGRLPSVFSYLPTIP